VKTCLAFRFFSPALTLVAFVALGALGALAARAAEALSQVGRWARFESAITNAKSYRDPYRDVALDVTYTRPDGGTVAFWGFYDGDATWRLRFLPDQTGVWRWTAKFSDGSPAASGAFECVPSHLPGPISVDAQNPWWFGRKDGGPMLIRALHVGDRFFAKNWDDAATDADGNKRAAFLDWAEKQGYNTLSIASHYLNRAAKGRGEGWDTPKLWPLDAAEYQRMERILDDLAARRFLVFPFAGFFGRASNFPRDPADQSLYIRYSLARLAASGNLLFNIAGPEPLLRNNTFLSADEVNRLGTAIAALDPFRHPISVHNPTGDDAFKDSPWLTYGTLQGPKTFDRRKLADGLLRNHHPQKPLLAQETLWSGNSIHMRANQGADYSDADLRKNAFTIHFCAANLVFADNDGDSSTGFTGTMDPKDCRQARHDIVKRVWDTIATLPWQRTAPHPEFVEVVSGGAASCLARPGESYLVYLESRGSVNVRVEGGPYTVEWINAQDSSDCRRPGTTRDGARLATPAEGDDWVLVLRAASR
jgi:hypothetical protein